jgi:hypothetical protein
MMLLLGEYRSILEVCLPVFIVGFMVGYGVRSGISRRRQAAARRRYITTGSFNR